MLNYLISFAYEASYTYCIQSMEYTNTITKLYVNNNQVPKMYIGVCLELLYYKKIHDNLIYHLGTKLF